MASSHAAGVAPGGGKGDRRERPERSGGPERSGAWEHPATAWRSRTAGAQISQDDGTTEKQTSRNNGCACWAQSKNAGGIEAVEVIATRGLNVHSAG